MGFPPPPDAPPPATQAIAFANAGFAAGPPVASLCGFAIPAFLFAFGFNVPPLNFPPPLPIPRVSLGINCSLTNPLNVTSGVAYGGGRVSSSDPDPDRALDGAS